MKATVAAVLALVSAASAQNVVRFDLTRGTNGIRRGKPFPVSRRDTFTQTAINNITGGGYYVEVKVGSPGQPVSMILDTGSSDAWVVSKDAELCTSERLQMINGDSCGGTYDKSKSDTYKLVSTDGFSIKYLDSTSASGDYISDNFAIGGATIKNLQMGLVTDTVRGTGILGVGFSEAESTEEIYPNIMDEFLDQGLVKSKAYSLWLNDRRSPSGTILFGGIDTDKFIGPLNIIDILKTVSGTYTAFAVTMSSIKVGDSAVDSALPAILDSGTTLSYLPDDMTTDMFDELGVYSDLKATGLALIDCSYLTKKPDMTFSFTFGRGNSTATIDVPVNEMVLDILGGYEDLLPSDIPFDDVCVFGIQSTDGFGPRQSQGTYALLGDTFLRSAYVVYDLDHKQIGIAQANLNSSTEDNGNSNSKNIVEINASDDGLPDVTGVAAQQTTYVPPDPTNTGGSGGTGTGGGSGNKATVTVTNSPTGNAAAGLAGGPGLEAVAVMAIAGMFAVFGGALFVL